MNKKEIKNRREYYLYGLFPLLILGTLFSFLIKSPLSIAVFVVGFVWPYSLFTPGLKEKITTRKYRFSFMSFVFHFYHFLKSSFGYSRFKSLIYRHLGTAIFFSLILFFARDLWILMGLLGSVLFEAFYWLTDVSSFEMSEKNDSILVD